MQNISLNVKPLSAKGITLLVFGIALIAIPALTQSIINLSLIALNIKLSLPTTIALLQNMTWLNLIPKIVGLSVVSALIIRSHLKVDSTKTKRQITKVSIIGLTALMFVGALIIETPVASAQATALTGYILDTPLPIADWYIGTYGTGNYFAINGSNWDNLMRGVGSTAWAAYATNYTKVEELVLASVTSGSVYLKDVPFDLALMGNIPENVQVECNYQGVTYKYINSASSLGSPYTISVGQGPNAGYYLAQDSGDRISWSSTDALLVLRNAINTLPIIQMSNTTGISQGNTNGNIPFYKGEVRFGVGDFVGHTMIAIPIASQVSIVGSGIGATRLIINNTGITNTNATNALISYYQNIQDITYALYYQKLTITDMVIDTSQEVYLSAISTTRAAYVDFERLIISGPYGEYAYGFHPNNYTNTINNYGIYLNNPNTNGPSQIVETYISGYRTGVYPTSDHLVMSNNFITDCYFGISLANSYDLQINKQMTYMTQYAYTFTNSIYGDVQINQPMVETCANAFFNGGINSTTTHNVQINMPYVRYNNASGNYHLTPTNDRRYFGGTSFVDTNVIFNIISWIPEPVLFYDFSECTGTITQDKSGYNHLGTILGATWTNRALSNKFNSLTFSTGNISIPVSTTLQSPNFTISTWIKPTAIGAQQTIIGTISNGGPYLRLNTDGTLSLQKENTGLIGNSVGAVSAGSWAYVTVSYNLDGQYIFYINGTASGTGTNAQTFSWSQQLIGMQAGQSYPFGGSMAMFSMYNRVLTSQEIQTLWCNYGNPLTVYLS